MDLTQNPFHNFISTSATPRSVTEASESVNWPFRGLVISIPSHLVFLVIGGINAFVLSILTPPFQVHDELQHFFRAYQLSEIQVVGSVSQGLNFRGLTVDRGGGVLPSSLSEFVEHTWGTRNYWDIPPVGSHRLADTWTEFHRRLAPDKREFTDFSGAVGYSPLPYLQQALAIAIGRYLDASPLALLYLGRIANALAAVALITYALSILPIGREASLVIALFPMAQFEYGSVAPDAGIIATTFLFTALALRATLRRKWSAADVALATLAGAVFCTIKIVYAPLLVIGLAAILPRQGERLSRATILHLLSVHLVIIVSVICLSVIWLYAASSTMGPAFKEGHSANVTAKIVAHPLLHLRGIGTELIFRGPQVVKEMIGEFGAWTVYPPRVVYAIAGTCVLLACVFPRTSDAKLGPIMIVWNCMLIGVAVGLIDTAVTIVCGGFVCLHGKYLLPLGMLAAATATSAISARAKPSWSPFVYLGVTGLVLFNTVITDLTIVRGFHLL